MKRNQLVIVSILALVAAGLLLAWSIRNVPIKNVVAALSSLQAWQIAAILVLNSGIILLFALRWWLILARQGYSLPYLDIARFRLAAFSISYFTPGQHFGGEPFRFSCCINSSGCRIQPQ